MLSLEQAVEIRVLSRQDVGVREIARQLGCSRNTVRRYLRDPEATRYADRAARPQKLDPYKAYLLARVEAARPHWIPATVLLREIREQGYDGGISQLKAFLAPLKRQEVEPLVRFETAPGEQMQVDFTTIRRGRHRLLAFVGTLGYSRSSAVRFCDREDAASWMDGLKAAFVHFGGVPKQVLFDNAKCVVIERDAYGDGLHRWHPDLLALAEDYGFQPKLCRPYRAKTKGKVERFNRYLKESFVTPLAASLKTAGLQLDVAAANAHVGRWLIEVADQRVHGTTGVKPAVRLDEERHVLQALPAARDEAPAPVPAAGRPVPIDSFQHPLSVYQDLLEVRP